GIEAAADLDVQAANRFIELVPLGQKPGAEFAGKAARRRDAELAGISAGAGDNVDDGSGSRLRELGRLQVSIELRQVGFADPAEDDILLDGGTHGFLGVAPRDVGHDTELIGSDIAERQRDGDGDVAGLLLLVDVGTAPAIEIEVGGAGDLQQRGRLARLFAVAGNVLEIFGPARLGLQDLAFFQSETGEFREPDLLDDKLQPGGVAVLLLAEAGEDAADGLGERQQLLLRDEIGHQLGLLRHGAKAAADIEGKAALTVLDLGDEPDIVDVCQRASLFGAAGKRNLELAAELLGVGVADQMPGERMGVGRHIEGFGAADAGDGAAGDVAETVAAGFARGDSDGSETPHDGGRVFDVDEVELDILARGDVGDSIGVFLGQFGECFELGAVQATVRNLDALHTGRIPHRARTLGIVAGILELLSLFAIVALAVVIALAIGAAAEARLSEYLVVDFAVFLESDFAIEFIHFGGKRLRQAALKTLLPEAIAGLHIP